MNFIQDVRRIKNPIYFDRMVAQGNIRQFLLVILLLPLLLVVGWFIGWLLDCILNVMGIHLTLDCLKDGIVWDTFENYINANGHEGSSFSHRLYMLMVGVFGAFLLNGILVSVIVSWVEKRSERWQAGELRYDKLRWFQKSYALDNHVVVIGGNEMVPELVRQLLSRAPTRYVLIMTNRDVASLRKRIASVLGTDEKRVVIYHGERTLIDDLSHLQIERADELYVIGEQLDIDQSGSHHDVKNMQCVKLMSQLLKVVKENPKTNNTAFSRKPCRVMFEYQSSFSVFQFTDVDSSISDVLDFKPFNYYETWAQNVLVCPTLTPDRDKDKYLPLEGSTPITPDSPDTVHLIIVGMSRMGIALGVEAAHIAHYPNFICNKNAGLRTRITFIDTIAKQEMQYVQGHYKELFALSRWRFIEAGDDNIYYNESGHIPYDANDKSWKAPLTDEKSHSPYRNVDEYTLGEQVVDVDWEFIQGNLEMPTVQCYIREAAMKENVRLTIAICFPMDNQSYAGSLYLPDEVYDENNNVVQVLAYQPYGDAMCQCFKNRITMKGSDPADHRNNFNQFAKLKAFGMMKSCYNIDYQEQLEEAANQLWEQYSKTCNGIGGRNGYRTKLGIGSTIKAGKSLAAQQWSNNYAAAHLWTKLRSIEWKGEDTIEGDAKETLAKLEHIRWNMEQLLLGYAPLNPKEQKSILQMVKETEGAGRSDDELKDIDEPTNKSFDLTKYPKTVEWLRAWENFDVEKEILKANMSHVDICSCEKLLEIDPEAFRYDEDLTGILPKIYNKMIEIIKVHQNAVE